MKNRVSVETHVGYHDMIFFKTILTINILLIISCNVSPNKNKLSSQPKLKETRVSIHGNRFKINGDFNGDGITDSLTEKFLYGHTLKEADKFYENIEYDSVVALTIEKAPISFVKPSNVQIDSLYISSGGQLFGLSFLKNEGDLNGDGTDEVSYVIDWADWSNLNTGHIVTYKNNKWTELYSFSIWDWQIPYPINDFEGLIKPIDINQIEIMYMNDEAILDTIIVTLNKIPNELSQ